jgi:hypothetical protein
MATSDALLGPRPPGPGGRNTEHFHSVQESGPRFGTTVKKLGCIPWADDSVGMAEDSLNFRRSDGPCNLSAISSVSSVDVGFKKVTFAHVTTDAAPWSHLLQSFSMLVIGLAGCMLAQLLFVKDSKEKNDNTPLIVAIALGGIFVVDTIIWYVFRRAVAIFGSPGVDCSRTTVEFGSTDSKSMISEFLDNKYDLAGAVQKGTHQNNVQSWTHSHKKMYCIPYGEVSKRPRV